MKLSKESVKLLMTQHKINTIIFLDLISDKERLNIIRKYCPYCGSMFGICDCPRI